MVIKNPTTPSYVATLPCPVCSFFVHSIYVQLRTLEMQLCRILTDLIVLLCVHNEWFINRIPAVHVQIYSPSFIISKVIRQLVHRSSRDSVSPCLLTFTRFHRCKKRSNKIFKNVTNVKKRDKEFKKNVCKRNKNVTSSYFNSTPGAQEMAFKATRNMPFSLGLQKLSSF